MQTSVRGVIAGSAVRTRLFGTAGIGALVFSMIEMIRLHLATVGRVDPFSDTISGYAWIDPGKALLEASVVWMSVGSLALFAALLSAGLRPSPTMLLLFSLWVTGLALAALFPASRLDWTFSGKVHWLASLLAFLSLPFIGFLSARPVGALLGSERLRSWVQRLSALATLVLLVYGITYLPSLLPGWPLADAIHALPIAGLTQRLALLVDVALLGVLGVALLRSTGSRAPVPMR